MLTKPKDPKKGRNSNLDLKSSEAGLDQSTNDQSQDYGNGECADKGVINELRAMQAKFTRLEDQVLHDDSDYNGSNLRCVRRRLRYRGRQLPR